VGALSGCMSHTGKKSEWGTKVELYTPQIFGGNLGMKKFDIFIIIFCTFFLKLSDIFESIIQIYILD
jgi:hypothetical protein